MRGERGDIVVGWLTKIALVLTLLGVMVFDVVSVGLTHVSAADDATNAAQLGSETWQNTRDIQRAYAAAAEYAEEHGGMIRPNTFVVADDGRVTVTVEKTATTLVLYRLGPAEKWARIAATSSAKGVPGS